MNIAIINGPNLNLLGQRQPEIYGDTSFEKYLGHLREVFPQLNFYFAQSNVEGELINLLHQAQRNANGVILNPGGYAHTSVALADAISAIELPVVEVHISNVFAREEYRHTLISASRCVGCISGFGIDGYRLAIEALLNSF